MSRTSTEVLIETLVGKKRVLSIHPRHDPVERVICDDEGRPLVKVIVRKVKRPDPPKLTGPGVSG